MYLSFNFLFFYYLLTPDPVSWKLWSLPTSYFLTCSSTVLFNHHCPYSHPFLMTYQDSLWFSRHPVSPPPSPLCWNSFTFFPLLLQVKDISKLLANITNGYPLWEKKTYNSGVSFIENRMPADNLGSKKCYAHLLFKQCRCSLATKDNPGFFSVVLFLAGI